MTTAPEKGPRWQLARDGTVLLRNLYQIVAYELRSRPVPNGRPAAVTYYTEESHRAA